MDELVRKYLYDIREAAASIFSYLGEKRDFACYAGNKMLRRAVISHKMQILAMRNRVIHGYDKIDDAIIWGVIVRHLPILHQEVEALMRHQDSKTENP